MKYNVGDKVRIKTLDWYNANKDEDGNVVCLYSYFDKDMSEFCNKIVTIKSLHGCPNVKAFRIIEDDGYSWWSDDMIEELVKEETKPKFKVGDRIITNKGYIGTFEGWVSDYQVRVLFPESGCNVVIHPKNLKLVEDEMSLDKAGQITDFEYEGLAYTLPDGYQFVDENDNEILTSKIILKKKKKEYPKTYEECRKVLGYEDIATHCIFHNEADEKLFNTLYDLKVCRDAYWKIAGDEMGLGKPWEPDYKNPDIDLYVIINIYNQVEKAKYGYGFQQCVFTFPTPEMRDAFKKNFDPDIEICKELL